MKQRKINCSITTLQLFFSTIHLNTGFVLVR